MKNKLILICTIFSILLFGCLNNTKRDKQTVSNNTINSENTIQSDTLISSSGGLNWYIADTSLLRTLTQNELNMISSNVGVNALEGYLLIQKINNYTLLLYVFEGEDFYTYIATSKDNSIIDELHAEGLSATPGEEDNYSDLPSFAILKNHSIKIHTKSMRNGIKSEIDKTYRINNQGKFYEVKE